MNMLSDMHEVTLTLRDEVGILRKDLNRLLEDVAVKNATIVERIDGFAKCLSRLETQLGRLPFAEAADLVRTTLPAETLVGGPRVMKMKETTIVMTIVAEVGTRIAVKVVGPRRRNTARSRKERRFRMNLIPNPTRIPAKPRTSRTEIPRAVSQTFD